MENNFILDIRPLEKLYLTPGHLDFALWIKKSEFFTANRNIFYTHNITKPNVLQYLNTFLVFLFLYLVTVSWSRDSFKRCRGLEWKLGNVYNTPSFITLHLARQRSYRLGIAIRIEPFT